MICKKYCRQAADALRDKRISRKEAERLHGICAGNGINNCDCQHVLPKENDTRQPLDIETLELLEQTSSDSTIRDEPHEM